MGDPVEAFLFIQLTKPTGKSIRIQALKDFNGAVKIQSKEDALKFCRIWTDHHFFWWFQPSALEVRYDPTRKLNGYGGSVRNHKWWKVVSSYPMLSQTSDQFVVKRLLIISKNRMRVKCYVSTETVGRNGEYSLSLDKFSVDKDFDSIFWYLPTVG